ncbi:thioredoxin-domain-containing protein [Stipitochalara longipes BDJ]|nr:thioredoxin-domain-containing protein [Stipitochalara longipes BDJ]
MQEIKSLSQFNKLKANPLLVIDFYATWCGPCKVISPVFDKLAKPHDSSTSIIFAKCDVDKAKDVAQACNITAMPTFQFFKQGKKVDEVKGADPQQLTTKIGYYTTAAAKETAGQGPSTKAGESSTSSSGPASLRPLIDINTAKLLNTSLLSSVRNIASPPPAGYAVASASGSRLLIHLPFTQTVTPSQLKITIAKDSISNAPSRIQIGTNVPVRVTKSPEGVETNDLDLESSISKAENTQSFNIYSDEYVNGVAELKLKASKFTGVKSLTIRIDANMSGEPTTVSKIGALDIIGTKL